VPSSSFPLATSPSSVLATLCSLAVATVFDTAIASLRSIPTFATSSQSEAHGIEVWRS